MTDLFDKYCFYKRLIRLVFINSGSGDKNLTGTAHRNMGITGNTVKHDISFGAVLLCGCK